ncbi:hydroxymethylglutaryl-CoA lyase [Nocardioides zeae]|uniref:Hydroxymethylglutaryl-CoA lyase n=1 Tax=Nocardioides imazamoxiresistens TaxID=3231893 RepID=A0ABU3PWM2_9ACTN|nr:hydroxymethylglutaryl-CoA lyase [Nocardioides zeae]MDT9593647.1 hydroxymethylglutaryl-CoA lyase [Nocardioides zeae]
MSEAGLPGLPALPASLRVVEVVLRDGLQAVPDPVLSTDDKVEVVRLLLEAGVREVEAVSFAHPKVLPQLADAADVMARVPREPGVRYRGLVPNLVGARRAADCGLDEIVLVVPADEGLARANQNRGVDELLDELGAAGPVVRESGADLVVAVASAFFAPARGDVPWAEAERVVDAAVAAGASGVYLAATTGMEHPYEMAAGVARVRARHPGLAVGVHLHNRNGAALANAVAAMQVGVDWIETACGGLGGDLWFPGPAEVLGNAPTEDLLHLCDVLGVATGIDLGAYHRVVDLVARLTGRPPVSFTARGGTRAQLGAAPWPDSPPGRV